MQLKKIMIPVIAVVAFMAAGCTSINYKAGPSYVGFSSEGVKSVKQTKKTSYLSDEMLKTFDDEFVYDEDGNIIKQIQTQYFDDGGKFDEFEITYQKIGGKILPKSAAINGVVYLEVEYDLLPVDHKGYIPRYTSIPVFYSEVYNFLLLEPDTSKWTMDLGNFDVPFRVDREFVKSEESFDYYSGFDKDSVLTSGYDNILLQKFYYSREKFAEGYNRTVEPLLRMFAGRSTPENLETTFVFKWDVKADKLVQDGVQVVERFANNREMNFNIVREFDSSARLTREVWTVADSKKGLDKVKTLFEQELSY